jgi:hypothetical protein
MVSLIAKLRKLVNDPASESQIFDDEDLQEFLDQNRQDIRRTELRAQSTVQPGGAVLYTDYYEPFSAGNWEDGVLLQNGSTWAAVTPTTSDLKTGHWTFTAGQTAPIYITGQSYDLFGAAVDALVQWAGIEKLNYDFSANGTSFHESQKVTQLLELACQYRKQMRIGSGQMLQDDYAKCN